MQVEDRCRITGVTNPTHLRASHCKPWRDSTNEERIDGENGLLLTPTIDHLFDRGFISFEDSGVLIVSPVAHAPSLNLMGLATDHVIRVGTFTQGQKQFLDYHRESVLLQARHHRSASEIQGHRAAVPRAPAPAARWHAAIDVPYVRDSPSLPHYIRTGIQR